MKNSRAGKIEILFEKGMPVEMLLHFIFALPMRYIHSHITHILEEYKGEMPLANYLKFYFKKHPILGSRDRKMISEMAYCFYRCAKGLEPKNLSLPEQIEASLLLAESNMPSVKRILSEKFESFYGKEFEENLYALNQLGIRFEFEHLISKKISFSEGINRADWLQTMLQRPRLFIRVGASYKTQVMALLTQAEISYELLGDYCFAMPNGTGVEKIIPEKMYRIQDASSQKTANYFTIKGSETCWDCCSGAGGKALLVMDTAPKAKLSVSDVRASILDNLAARFNLYGHPIPERIQLSVSDPQETGLILGDRSFTHIIADVPCTGSGTWARTPEQLYFFNPETIKNFTEQQKRIASNALYYLKRGGTFIYITCSVFEEENEAVVAFLQTKYPDIALKQQQLINGIGIGADSMFVAVFERAI